MPIEWVIIFLYSILSAAYFSFKTGFRKGVEECQEELLYKLEENGIINIDEKGKITANCEE